MNMNHSSRNAALGLSGIGLLVSGIAHLLVDADRIALAENVGGRSPVGASVSGDPARRDGDLPPKVVAMGSGEDCVEGSRLDWFGTIREFPECGFQYGPPRHGDEVIDVNGDGLVEAFVRSKGSPVATSGAPLPDACFVSLVTSELSGDATRVTVSCILQTQPLAEWILSRTGWQEDINCDFGWNDVDRDGDMDLVVGFSCACSSGFERKYAWLENTGFEASQPLVGDLNHDGLVNPADLAMLLGGWTGG